jgi:acetyltransferase-like isoleucine patch superfamily enzyme
MTAISITYKAIRKAWGLAVGTIFTPIAKMMFILNNVQVGSNLRVLGLVKVYVTRRGVLRIGDGLKINSGPNHNIIGRQQKTTFWVEGTLRIGNNVGMSSCAIICNHEITIGDNVVLGGNTVIYDTNFHSLDPTLRNDSANDRINAKWAPVHIKSNVFIGAHTTILKGVVIGENSVIGAGSLVSSNVPDNQIWAGNPAVCVRKIS